MVKEFFDSVDFSEYWSYPGSLTTPPCWEGIKWNVIKEVQSISPAQLAEFTKNWADNADFANGNGNNRVVMPINDRTLLMSNAAAPAANQQNNTDDGASAVTTFGAAVIAAVASLAF